MLISRSSTSPRFVCTSDSSSRVGVRRTSVFYFQSGASASDIDVIRREARGSQICRRSGADIQSKERFCRGRLRFCSPSPKRWKKRKAIIRLRRPAGLRQTGYPRAALRRPVNANRSRLPGKAAHVTVETVALRQRPGRSGRPEPSRRLTLMVLVWSLKPFKVLMAFSASFGST